MSKVKIIDKRSEKSIKTEREFLSKLRHPFIVNMNCAFQDFENLYLVMDLLTGGDLRYHVCKLRRFSENKTRFFFACIILGLEYIHSNNIIHRDIKPENLVFDDKGYLRITDFGVAKIRKEDNSTETSGTPGYMAPEVLLAQNHSFPVDFFAIGIMGYEFMYGQRPYLGKNRKEIKLQVLRKQAKIYPDDIPEGWGPESVDFINSCLKRKDSRRLGFTGGVNDLKNHIWFKDFDWDALLNKTLKAPFIPITSGNDTRMTTNTKYSKPMISTNPSANIDKRKHRINNIADSGLVFNTQKKNKFSDNVEQIYSKDNFNIISNKLLDSFDNMEKNIDNKKETYKIQYESQNNNSNEENTNINLIPSSHTSLYNHYNSNLLGYNNIKNINDIITPNKKIIRSGSVGLINLENNKQNNKKKYIEYNSNKINGNKKII